MAKDPEIEAMSTVAGALDTLDAEAKSRVLRWAGDRYGVSSASHQDRDLDRHPKDEEADDFGKFVFGEFSDLYDAADPSTDQDKALVAGYWLQVSQGKDDFEAFPANKALKDLGHGIGNITRAFNGLIATKPRLVMQIQKQGSSKQARKRYKLTKSGERRVEEMMQ